MEVLDLITEFLIEEKIRYHIEPFHGFIYLKCLNLTRSRSANYILLIIRDDHILVYDDMHNTEEEVRLNDPKSLKKLRQMISRCQTSRWR